MMQKTQFKFLLLSILFSLNVLGAGTFIQGPALIEGFTTITSAAGTTTLTVASETKQIVTGATTQTIVLPDATTLPLGRKFYIINKSSGDVTVNDGSGALLVTVAGGTQAEVHLRVAGGVAGTWDVLESSAGGGGGGTWGSITGTLSDQTDLQAALDAKADENNPSFAGTIGTTITASRLLVTDASSNLSASSVTSTEAGYLSGVTGGIQTQLDAKQARSTLTTKGDLYVATASATVTRQGIGSDGQVLTADSGQTNGLKWATPSSNPVTTKGDLAGYDTAANRVPVGSNNQFLMADSGSSLGLKWQPFFPPNIQKFTSGSGTYTLGYAFLISSGSATAGATYTNNGNTYTVLGTVSSSTLIYLSGSSDPTSSGTLTKASGTGDASLTFSAASKSKYIRVRMVGGGGGGAGSGNASGGNGGNGGNSTFGSGLLSANGGAGATWVAYGGTPGAGGSSSLGTGPIGSVITGSSGSGAGFSSTSNTGIAGGAGGNSFFGGAGGGGTVVSAGLSAATNSGSGGGGGGNNGASPSTSFSGHGGGAGGFVDAIISNPVNTYPYSVGGGGSAGSAGTSGLTGGAGGSGYIEVTEYYQ